MQTRWFNFLVLLSLVLGLLPVTAAQAASETAPLAQAGAGIEVEPALRNQLAANETTGYLIYFKEKPDLSPAYKMDWIKRGRFVANALNQTALRSQAQVRAYLDAQGAKYKAFWIENVIVVESSNLRTFNALSSFPEVSALRARREPMLHEPVEIDVAVGSSVNLNAPTAIEPNLLHIDVDDAWGLGYSGAGIVVANIDTGVRYTHQALVNQYRGNQGGGTFDHNYNWWDPYDHDPAPNDTHNHGSHTMGTMVGDDGGANQIGVAPGATWMACQGFNPGATDAGLLECAQFMAAPWDLTGANANPDLRPHVVNNSWGDCGNPTVYDPWYEGVVAAWHAMGIYPVFSNGNTRTECPQGIGQVGNPARYGSVTGVGALGTSNATLASYSLWGPTNREDTINPRGYPYLKPQVSAPGTNRSAYRGSDTTYGGMSGTSMAAPHVVGLIALMWEAAPCLVGNYAATETILEETTTATSWPGYPGHPSDGPGGAPNQATGWGEINALAAVQAAAASCGDSTITGEVLDASTNATIAGVAILATNNAGTAQHKATSNDLGVYALNVFSDTYTLQASRYGYQTAVIPGVVATTGATTTQHIALTPAAIYEVSGQVTDAATGWPLYAQISIAGDPVSPAAPDNSVWTDPATGEYSVMLAEGITYTFQVAAWVPGYVAATGVVGPLTTDATADFALQADMAACMAPGYAKSVTPVSTEGFESTTFPPGGWSAYNRDGGGTRWVRSTTRSYSGAASAAHLYSTAGTQDGWLVMPPIVVPGGEMLELVYWEYTQYPSWYEKHSLWACTTNCATPPTNWTQITEFGAPVASWRRQQTALNGYGGQTVYLAFRYEGYDADDWYIDQVTLNTFFCATPTDGGLVVGNVYDENYPAVALDGATVVNAIGGETSAVATPDDAAVNEAFYTLFAPSGTQTFTATATGGYAPDVAAVNVVGGGAVVQDFYLPAGRLSAVPTGLDVTVELGYEDTRTLNLSNTGGAAAEFTLIERAGQIYPINIAAFTGELAGQDLSLPSAGPAPRTSRETVIPAATDVYPLAAARPAFAAQIYPSKNLVYIPDTTVPGTWNVVGSMALGGAFAGDFLGGDFSQMYVLDYATNKLYSVNTATGVATLIGNSVPASGQSWSGMTGALDGTLYASSAACGTASTLYIVNPATGALTQIGPITNGPCIIDIAINADGEMYGVDIVNDALVKIDPNTGAGTVVGALGFAANYAQGLDFEEESGILYWAAYGTSGELRVIDTTTGASARIGAFPGGAEVDCLAFPTGGVADVPWLAETPTAGTVSTGSSLPVAVDFDAAFVDQPGKYHADLIVKNDTPYGKFSVPVTMTVVAPVSWGKLTGTVVGLGVCDGAPAPLEEAEVRVQSATTGQTWLVTTGADGVYHLWLDQAHSPLNITVTAPDYSGVASRVVVRQGQTTVVDFDLRLQKPCLVYNPADFDITLPMGDNTSRLLTLSNTGAAVAEYELVELNSGFTPLMKLHIPQRMNDAPVNDTPASSGAAPVLEPPTTVVRSESPLALLAPNGSVAYATEPNVDQFLSLDVAVPGTFNIISPFAAAVWAGDFGANGVLYAIDSDANRLISIDPTTGAPTVIGPIVSSGGQSWTGMALDPTSGIMYAASATCGTSSNLYTVDLQTGAATLVGAISNAACAIALGINNTGQAYTYDIVTDQLLRVDKTTGAGTVVGFIGFDANYGQGMDFDEASGQMLMAAFNYDSFQGELRVVDLNTGATALVGVLGGSGGPYQLGWLALPSLSAAGGIPWLTETPISGTIAADTDAVVNLTFDAGVPETMQPGTYYGQLKVTGNAANEVPNVPLTLTVTAPATWGKLMGTVTGLGYCDAAAPALLADAEITVESGTGLVDWLLATDANGAYQLWLDAAHSPVDITIAYPDHVTQAFENVVVTAGGTTVRDAALRWAKPCLSVDPDMFDVTVTLGLSATLPFSLTNAGAANAAFNLTERNSGSIISRALFQGPAVNVSGSAMRLGPTTPRSGPSLAAPAAIVIQDGSFEDGTPNSYWNEYSTNFGTPICDVASCGTGTGTGPRTGSYWTWFGGIGVYEEGSVDQDVTIPAGIATLSFWLEQIICGSPTDYMQVLIDGEEVFATDGTSSICGVLGYSEVVVDVTDYADGGVHNIMFYSESNAGSNIFVDDVALDVIEGVTPGIPWLFENPASGVVAADSTFVVALTFDASAAVTEVTQPGKYFGALFVNSNDPIKNRIPVPVTMTVAPPATWGKLMGTVQSLGYCDADPAPVAGLNVLIEGSSGMTWTVTTNVSGTYQLWLDESESPVAVAVEAPAHSKGEETVTVVAGATTTQNFDLRWLVPCVDATPAGVHTTLELGTTATEVMTLTNTGAVDTDWNLVEENLGPDLTVTPPQPAQNTLLAESFEGVAFPPAGWGAYNIDGGGSQWLRSTARAYAGSASALHAFSIAGTQDGWLVTPAVAVPAVGTSRLSFWEYTAYTSWYVKHSLWVCTSGCATPPTNWTQVTEFGSPTSAWRQQTVNLSAYAGQTIYLAFRYEGYDADNWHVDAVWIYQDLTDQVPWLAENPTAGVLVADTGEQVVDVDFDASVVDQPGDYVANLRVNSDDPFAPAIVPVTMTVTAPASWGELLGVVSSLGRCDLESNLLAGAQIVIWDATATAVVTLTTNASGTYSYWLPNGAYTVTVTAADHIGDSAVVAVPASGAVTQNFSLTWLGPCVTSIEPSAMEVTVAMGVSETLPLTMTNVGAGGLNFRFLEKDKGFAPSVFAYNVGNLSKVGSEDSASPEADNGKEILSGLPVGTSGQVLALPNPWVVIPPMPTAVSRPAGAAVAGKFYVLGGEPGYTGVQVYDPVAGTWSAGPAMPTGVSNACAAVIGADIYLPGSGAAGAVGAQLQVFHIASNTWETITSDPLPSARFAPACAAYQGKLYVFAGGDGVAYLNTAWVYNPAAAAGSRWSALANAPISAGSGGAITIGDNIFWAGMRNATADLADVYAYNVPSNSWVTYPNLPVARGGAGLWAIGNLLYVGGGGWTTYSTAVYKYDTSLGTGGSWSVTNPLVQGRRTFAWASSPETGRLYVGAGWAGAYLNEAEETIFPPVGSIPWLFEDPESGTVPPATAGVADIIFDAGVPEVTQPGTYTGLLTINNNDPVWDGYSIPVTMHVTLPETYGQITGTVKGLGPCDDPLTAVPLQGAAVTVESASRTWPLSTGRTGGYALWLDESHSPVTITVAADGYLTAVVTGVQVVSGTTTVQDLVLMPNAPCAYVTPETVAAILTVGMSTTVPITIGNTGIYTLSWQLSEEGGVPWLAETPTSGDTAPGGTSTVAVTFDAAGLMPGEYTALLVLDSVMGNTPIFVPVTLTVEAPATWGRLEGLVQGLGYCDVMTTPLEGAVVFVQSWMTETVDTLFLEDFESSSGGFTHSGTQDEWQWGTPTTWPNVCASGSRCWGTDLAGTYNANSDQVLLSPVIDLRAVAPGTVLTVTWQQAWHIESATWDHGYAEVSINGGAWTQMWAHIGGTAQVSWTPMSYDITTAAGGTVQFRWRLTSDGSVQYSGYYIDDVRILTAVPAVVPMSWALTTGADGAYGLWLDEMYSPFTVTISYEAGYDAQVFTAVGITGGAVTTQNANLLWLQPCMTVAPDALAVSVEMGTSAALDLNLANLGAFTGTFEINERSLGFEMLGPLATGGPDAFGYRFADSKTAGVSPVYDFVDISGIGTPVALGDNTFTQVAIGFDFKFYGASAGNPNLYDRLFVSSNGFLSFGVGSADISPDPVLPDPTLPNNLIAVAWTDLKPGVDGMAYVQSFAQCPYNPAGTAVDACFIVQYTNFVHANGNPAGTFEAILFRSGSILMQYAKVDAPNATTGIEGPLGLIGLNYGPALADRLAICFAYPGEETNCRSDQVSWLSVDGDEGNIAAYDDATVVVTLDASVPEVTLPGDYLAELRVQTNDPQHALFVIPVTMTVVQPTNLARLAGVVTAWSQCDAVSQTLAGAQVGIVTSSGDNFLLTTDAAGAYAIWLTIGDAYTITVSHPDYVPVVVIGAAETVMLLRNVALRVNKPCIRLTPTSYEVTLPKDRSTTRAFTIANSGAGDFAFNNIRGSSLWLSVLPKSGVVPADSSVPVTLTFAATGLVAGSVYSTVLEVIHTNPNVARLIVRPVRLTVLDVPQVLVDVVKTVVPADFVLPGELLTYTVVFTNSYDMPLDLTATDAVPANTTYVLGSVSGATVVDPPGNVVTWAGSLEAGASATFSFVVRVNATVELGTMITNTVTVTANNLPFTAEAVVRVGRVMHIIYLPLVMRNAQ